MMYAPTSTCSDHERQAWEEVDKICQHFATTKMIDLITQAYSEAYFFVIQ